MQEMSDPALSLERARATWKKHGRSEKWIQQRMTGQETRNKLTDFWTRHKIKKGEEYAILTNLIHQEWSGVSVKSHKDLKNLTLLAAQGLMNRAGLRVALETRRCPIRRLRIVGFFLLAHWHAVYPPKWAKR